MDGLNKPKELTLRGDKAGEWVSFEMLYDTYIASLHYDKPERAKAAILLNLAGEEAQKREKAFVYKPEIKNDSDEVIQAAESRECVKDLKKKFREICNVTKNTIMERHAFNTRNQKKIKDEKTKEEIPEDIVCWISDLINLSKTCEYGELTDALIRDRIVVGLLPEFEHVRMQLLKKSTLTLDKAVEICKINEQSVQASSALKQKKAAEVDVIEKQHTTMKTCQKCGRKHGYGRCPAHGTTCDSCGGKNHWSSVCRNKKHSRDIQRNKGHKKFGKKKYMGRKGSKKVYQIEVTDSENSDEEEDDYDSSPFQIDTIEDDGEKEEIHSDLVLNGRTLTLKIDTGARINVISLKDLQKIKKKYKIDTSKVIKIKAYGGDTFKTLGTVNITCHHNHSDYNITFHVVDRQVTSLLGLQDTIRLELIQLSVNVHQITEDKVEAPELEEFKDLFDNTIGKLPVVYKMKIDKDAVPVVKPPRKIPIAMKEAVKSELDRMEKLGVVQKVEEPTEWVSSMVAAKKKNGDIRICLDPKDLNDVLQRPHHPMKTIDQVISDIPNAKYFTILDAKTGFWQVPLHKDSTDYTTFNTIFGRYKFRRMPYGIKSGSEVFQNAMDVLFSGYPCEIIVDDILIWGTTLEEHNEKVKKVLERTREINMKLNKKKCKFRVDKVSYVGHLLTSEGVSPDPSKVKAITEMPPPEDIKGLQRLLGMTNYLAKFINNYSELTATIRTLLHKDTEWCWQPQHQEAFEKLKKAITNPPTLRYYDVKKPVVLQCDASQSGLGAGCLQDGAPIAYASRAMTETEQRYAQIEKELLAVTFACNKFHDYIYGRTVTIETDHEPLITIMKKPIHSAPARLQKMMMRLQKYQFHLVYKRGTQMYIADTLSRAYLSDTEEGEEDQWYDVMEVLPVSDKRRDELVEATESDHICNLLKHVIVNGWPKQYKKVPKLIQDYYAFREELVIQDELIVKGQRIVVPVKLQSEYLQELHQGHSGVEATKARARETVYWPQIAEDIAKKVSSCSPCNELKHKQQKEPMTNYEVPEVPYELVATDLFEFQSEMYSVTVDSYSGFYDIDKLENTTSKTVIRKLKNRFATHGSPKTLITDNASYYTSKEFKEFTKKWKIGHRTISPTYSQSNGLGERAVQSAKELLQKCTREGSDLYLALLHVRNTPRGELDSACKRLMSRVTRTTLPTTLMNLKPQIVNNVKNNLTKVRMQKKKHYNKTARKLPKLNEDDIVRIQGKKGYDRLAKVIGKADRPNSYVVKSNGREYERNRRHLLVVNERLPTPPDEIQRPQMTMIVPVQRQPGKIPETPKTPKLVPPLSPAAPVPTTPSRMTSPGSVPKPGTPLAIPPTPIKVSRFGRTYKPNPKFADYVKN